MAYLFSVQKDPVAFTSDARVNGQVLAVDGKLHGVPLNAHFAAPHRVTSNEASLRDDSALARQSETVLQVSFLRAPSRQALHSFSDFD
jgi:hypothetical protein